MSLVFKITFLILTSFSAFADIDLDCPDGTKQLGASPPNGTLLRCIMPFKGKYPGLRHGPLKMWWPNGKIKKEDNYKMDVLDGESKTYTSRGKIYSITNYKDGLKEGFSYTYDAAGQVKGEQFFREGELVTNKKTPNQSKKIVALKKSKSYGEDFMPFSIKSKMDLIFNCKISKESETGKVEDSISFLATQVFQNQVGFYSIDQYFVSHNSPIEKFVPYIKAATLWLNMMRKVRTQKTPRSRFPYEWKYKKDIYEFSRKGFKLFRSGEITSSSNITETKMGKLQLPAELQLTKKIVKKGVRNVEIKIFLSNCEKGAKSPN